MGGLPPKDSRGSGAFGFFGLDLSTLLMCVSRSLLRAMQAMIHALAWIAKTCEGPRFRFGIFKPTTRLLVVGQFEFS